MSQGEQPSSIELKVESDFPQKDYQDSCHPLAWTLSILFPCSFLGSCFSVNEQEHAIILHYGKFTGHKTQAGCYCSNPCGREVRKITTRRQTVDLKNIKVVDFNANPLLVSGVVTFFLEQTVKSALDVEHPISFISTQATAVLKRIVSKYPYEATDGVSLQHETGQISNELVQLLQSQVKVSGARIVSFQLNEISYAPEIAQGMLKRQLATALVSSRKTIVKGAVDISHGAITQLEEKGIKMTDQDKARIVGNLLVVICSDKEAEPTINLSNN